MVDSMGTGRGTLGVMVVSGGALLGGLIGGGPAVASSTPAVAPRVAGGEYAQQGLKIAADVALPRSEGVTFAFETRRGEKLVTAHVKEGSKIGDLLGVGPNPELGISCSLRVTRGRYSNRYPVDFINGSDGAFDSDGNYVPVEDYNCTVGIRGVTNRTKAAFEFHSYTTGNMVTVRIPRSELRK